MKYSIKQSDNLEVSIEKHIGSNYTDEITNFVFLNNSLINFDEFNNSDTLQTGGNINEQIFEFNDKQFIFRFDGKKTISIKNILDDDINCVVIVINKKQRLAIVQDLSYYYSCSNPKTDSGTELLILTQKFLKCKKDLYGIDKIVLQDNSIKHIKKCKNSIRLTINYVVLNGDTWYGKYGFLPFDQINDKINEKGVNKYNRNKDIIKNTKVKDHLQFFSKYSFTKIREKYHDNNLANFLKRYVKKHPKYECEFNDMIIDLFNELKLTNFTSKVFCYYLI
jgi:hypothetical protein